MGMAKPLPDAGYLNEVLSYDQQTGVFLWRVSKMGRGAKKGQPAGTWKPDGYLSIMIDGKRYPAHRLAWKMATGNEPGIVVDHADGNPGNNKLANLRAADLSKNAHNSTLTKRNTSGAKGVSFHKRSGLYRAQFATQGKTIYLGYFETVSDAEREVEIARNRVHGEFACHGKRMAS